MRPTLERATAGSRIQVGADRTGADARGEQVEYRVVGGVSCVEASGTIFGGVAWEHPVISGDAQRLNGQGPRPDGGLGRRSGGDDNRDFIKMPMLTSRVTETLARGSG